MNGLSNLKGNDKILLWQDTEILKSILEDFRWP